MSWSQAWVNVVQAIGAPYGYTVVLWSTGALVIARYGLPSTVDILLFALGGVGAYLAFAGLTEWLLAPGDSPGMTPQVSRPLVNLVPVAPPMIIALITREIRLKSRVSSQQPDRNCCLHRGTGRPRQAILTLPTKPHAGFPKNS